MATDTVTYSLEGKVARIGLDDGKVNALSPAVVTELGEALNRAEKEAGAVLLVGRPGRFSAGFDLSVMRGDDVEAAGRLVLSGAELLVRLYSLPLPVVVACTGHAIALGALLVLVSDRRIAAEGEFKLGLNEVAIGMTLPGFAIELASDRLSKRHFVQSALEARIYSPTEALDAGWIDAVAPPEKLVETAMAEAQRLAELPSAAYAGTKDRLRRAVTERLRATLEEEFGGLSA